MSKKAKGSKKGQNSKNDEYYTEEEVRRLDALQELTNKKFSDEELYDYMLKYKSNDEIMNELKEELKTRNRGKEYEWNEVGKSKYTNFYIILKQEKKKTKLALMFHSIKKITIITIMMIMIMITMITKIGVKIPDIKITQEVKTHIEAGEEKEEVIMSKGEEKTEIIEKMKKRISQKRTLKRKKN